MRILGIITARKGSKGVLGKNNKFLGDLPLVAYTAKAALESKYLAKVILSTDDATTINIVKPFQIEVPFVRPQALATDSASSLDVVQHAIEFLEEKGEIYDAVCLLQPTSPFRPKGFIDKAIDKFINEELDALVSVLQVPHEYNPHWVFESDEKGLLKIATGENEIIKRRQDLPPAYFRDGAIYITKVNVIKQGTFYGTKLSYIQSDPEFYINIDTPQDWEKAKEKLPLIKDRL